MLAGSDAVSQKIRTIAVTLSAGRIMQGDDILSAGGRFQQVLTLEHFTLRHSKGLAAGAAFAVFKRLLPDFLRCQIRLFDRWSGDAAGFLTPALDHIQSIEQGRHRMLTAVARIGTIT